MFSSFRFPAFLLAFVFLFFGVQGIDYASASPARVEIRLTALAPSAPGVAPAFADPLKRSEISARSGSRYNFITLQVSRMKWATVLFAPTLAHAEGEAAAPEVKPAIEPSDLDLLLKAIGGAKGGGALAIALAVVQGLMMVFKAVAKPSGGWQLTVLSVLTLLASVLTMKVMGGASWAMILTSAPVLAAIQVYLNQILQKTVLPAKA